MTHWPLLCLFFDWFEMFLRTDCDCTRFNQLMLLINGIPSIFSQKFPSMYSKISKHSGFTRDIVQQINCNVTQSTDQFLLGLALLRMLVHVLDRFNSFFVVVLQTSMIICTYHLRHFICDMAFLSSVYFGTLFVWSGNSIYAPEPHRLDLQLRHVD